MVASLIARNTFLLMLPAFHCELAQTSLALNLHRSLLSTAIAYKQCPVGHAAKVLHADCTDGQYESTNGL